MYYYQRRDTFLFFLTSCTIYTYTTRNNCQQFYDDQSWTEHDARFCTLHFTDGDKLTETLADAHTTRQDDMIPYDDDK